MADKMLEAELSECLEGAEGQQIVTRINAFFDDSSTRTLRLSFFPAPGACSSKERRPRWCSHLWYEAKRDRIYVDQCGMEETDRPSPYPTPSWMRRQ